MKIKQKLINYKNNVLTSTSVSFKEQMGYSGGIFGNTMGQDSVTTYGDKFNRNFMGISNKMLLIKGNVSTILSFIIPPIAGAWYDMPENPGKRSNLRSAIMVMPIPFAITSLLLFIVPSDSALFNFIWVFFLGLIFSVSDTFYDIAMNALALKLVSHPKDRKNFFTAASLAASLGSMLPGWLIPIVVSTTDNVHRQQWIYFFVALGFCIIGIASMYAPYFTIDQKREFIVQTSKKPKETEKIKWDRKTIGMILHNRPFVIIQISMIFDMIRKITYDTLPYLYDDIFADFKMKAIIDMISGALSYAGLFAVPFVGSRVSARNMMAGGYAYTGFFYILMSLFNIHFDLKSIRKKRYVVGILIGLAGMPNAAQSAARKMLVADSTDYMEWYARRKYSDPMRSDGMLIAAQCIVSKIIELLKANLYNGLFELIKYKPKAPGSSVKPVQSVSTLKGIYTVITLCGVIGNLFAAITFMFDNYTGKRREKIFAELTEMRATQAEKEEPQLV